MLFLTDGESTEQAHGIQRQSTPSRKIHLNGWENMLFKVMSLFKNFIMRVLNPSYDRIKWKEILLTLNIIILGLKPATRFEATVAAQNDEDWSRHSPIYHFSTFGAGIIFFINRIKDLKICTKFFYHYPPICTTMFLL